MLKAFLIIATLLVAAYSQSAAITMAFNQEWTGEDRENKVRLTWAATSNNQLEFNLVHPQILTGGIQTLLFLKDNSTGFIQAFDPFRANTTSNGAVYQSYTQSIPFADFDSVSKFPCTRSETDNFTTTTCAGIFTILVGTDVSATDRAANFEAAKTKGLIEYNFVLSTRINKVTQSSLVTFIKTKVKGLPCTNCQCDDVCEVIPDFKATSQLCADATCDTARANDKAYTFGEEGIIQISFTPTTRKFDLLQFYAQSPDSGDNFTLLSNTFIKSWNNTVAGKVILKLDMAGPANITGAQFNLKFIMKAQATPALRLRLLQAAKPGAGSIDVQNVKFDFTKPVVPKPNPTNPDNQKTGLERLGQGFLLVGLILMAILF